MRSSLKGGRARALPGPALVSTPWATLSAARGGRLVIDVDLFLAHVLLDDLLVLDDVLADSQLFLDHRTLLDDDLFLGHRHHDLVLADLGLRGLPTLDRHPLDADLLVPSGHGDLLTVGPHPLAHVDLPCL